MLLSLCHGQSIEGRSIRHMHVLLEDVICQVTTSSDDSVSSEYINNIDQMIEDLKRQIDEDEQQITKHKQQVAASNNS
jgi:hypothetical protein